MDWALINQIIESVATHLKTSIPALLWGFATPLPLVFIVGIGWEYFASMVKGKRSIVQAARQAFPFRDYRSVSFRSDFGNFWLGRLVFGPPTTALIQLLTLLISAEIVRSLLIGWFGDAEPLIEHRWLIVAAQMIVFVLSTDLGEYFSHSMAHRIPFLWSFHRVHHSAETLTLLTGGRGHPVDFVLLGIMTTIVNALCFGTLLYYTPPPADPKAVIDPATLSLLTGFFTLGAVQNALAHSRVKVSLGWLNYVFVGPVMHQLHHSAELRHRDKNFGGRFALWDWMFGTIYIPRKDETWRLGLNEEEMGARNPHIRIWDYYVEPLHHIAATFFGKKRLQNVAHESD